MSAKTDRMTVSDIDSILRQLDTTLSVNQRVVTQLDIKDRVERTLSTACPDIRHPDQHPSPCECGDGLIQRDSLDLEAYGGPNVIVPNNRVVLWEMYEQGFIVVNENVRYEDGLPYDLLCAFEYMLMTLIEMVSHPSSYGEQFPERIGFYYDEEMDWREIDADELVWLTAEEASEIRGVSCEFVSVDECEMFGEPSVGQVTSG